MFQTNLLKTTTFRAALLYLSIFLFSSSTLYAYLFWNTFSLISSQTDAAIEADIADLSQRYKEGGIPSLARRVAVLSRDPRLSIYLLIDPEGRPMAGNLNKIPDMKDAGEDWQEFEFVRITNNFEEKPGKIIGKPIICIYPLSVFVFRGFPPEQSRRFPTAGS